MIVSGKGNREEYIPVRRTLAIAGVTVDELYVETMKQKMYAEALGGL